MKSTFLKFSFLLFLAPLFCQCDKSEGFVTIDDSVLLDKIKGGWAGQTIGCSYGGSTEFKYQGITIDDSIPIAWSDDLIKNYFDNNKGLFDDVYMDLTFVDVFEKYGLDAHVDSFATAFANADYLLWHANQGARYNILNGIMPPESGHWKNSPHADDIDFQIESDFAGLMSPGMPNTATEIAEKIGHIMNYGNGLYGGIYISSMYAEAFIQNNIKDVVTIALKSIPQKSSFYKCMSDVISCYESDKTDWKKAWNLCQSKYNNEIGCPDGVDNAFNIDALINSAYVIIGLLYGEGDFEKTMEISTRCGQDSDCNPASAAGILATMTGYSSIPEKYKKAITMVEDSPFAFMSFSLNRVYEMGMRQAKENIIRNGGKQDNGKMSIKIQQPVAVPYEESFQGLEYKESQIINKSINDFGEYKFEGKAIVVGGYAGSPNNDYKATIDVILNGSKVDTVVMPVSFNKRKLEIYFNYELPQQEDTISFKWTNPEEGAYVTVGKIIIYK